MSHCMLTYIVITLLGNALGIKALLCFLPVPGVSGVDLKALGGKGERAAHQATGRLLPAIKAASPPARPYTGQAELGGQVRSQAGAWERGQKGCASQQDLRVKVSFQRGVLKSPFDKGGLRGIWILAVKPGQPQTICCLFT